MRLSFTCISFLCILFFSCSVSEKNSAGNYALTKEGSTQLRIGTDKQFEWIRTSGINSPTDTLQRYYTQGHWETKGNKLILYPLEGIKVSATATDSIARFTNISSFHFRNRFGDPVPIRYMVLFGGKPKPHFGNTIFFFAQDFKPTDTVHFHFDGYPVFSYPGSIPYAIGDNTHTITLTEPSYPTNLPAIILRSKKKKLVEKNSNRRWYKKPG